MREFLCALDLLPAVGGVNITGKALKHIAARHLPGGSANLGASTFGRGENIADLIRRAESATPIPQPNGNFQRVVDAGRTIGTDITTGQPTSIYTVITDAADNLVTSFPGRPRGRPWERLEMAITIRLQGEDGETIEEVHDRQGIITTYLPPLSDQSYHCLRFIDPYGDTYFNRMQMETLLAEWDRIFDKVQEGEAKRLSIAIKALAHRCQQEPHLYLKFLGD